MKTKYVYVLTYKMSGTPINKVFSNANKAMNYVNEVCAEYDVIPDFEKHGNGIAIFNSSFTSKNQFVYDYIVISKEVVL